MGDLVHSASGSVPVERVAARDPNAGDVVRVAYPFVSDTYMAFDGVDEAVPVPTWKPGVRWEQCGPEDMGAYADAVGAVEFTVVDVFKPGKFPTRVFVTRKFIDPYGRVFGKGKLHIWTLEKFRRLSRGYQHAFELAAEERAA